MGVSINTQGWGMTADQADRLSTLEAQRLQLQNSLVMLTWDQQVAAIEFDDVHVDNLVADTTDTSLSTGNYNSSDYYEIAAANLAPTMSANNAPSPNALYAVDKAGATTVLDAVTTPLWHAMNGTVTDADDCCFLGTLIQLDSAAVTDEGDGKVGLPCTANTVQVGDYINVEGTTNYNKLWTGSAAPYEVLAGTTANKIVVTATYVEETLTGTAKALIGPTDEYPLYVCIDLGSGVAKRFDKTGLVARNSATRRTITDVVVSGSNTASPTKHTDTNWTVLSTSTGLTDPGAGTERVVTFTNSTPYRWYRLKITGATNQDVQADVAIGDWALYGRNIEMITTSWEASANDPTDAFVLLQIDTTASYTEDTDIKAYISMDNGAHYEQVTGLDTYFEVGDVDYIRGDISGLTARTDKTMRLKVTTYNQKALKVTGFAVGLGY